MAVSSWPNFVRGTRIIMSDSVFFNTRRKIRRFILKMPGKALGEFRLLPIFFVIGALLEYTMIHWKVGEVNFYRTYKRRRVEEAVEQRLQQMKMKSAENIDKELITNT